MADKQVTPEQNDSNEIVDRARGFWAKYNKKIVIGGIVIIALLAGFIAYKKLITEPNEAKANDLIFPAEKLFGKMAGSSLYSKDTVNMVLNGDKAAGVTGLLKVASSYGGTKSGNRAKYIIGACYLNLKQYDKAISFLKDFDANGATQIQSKAYLLIGSAYAEQKKTDDALEYYKKAGSISNLDEAMASEAMFIAGVYAKEINKTKEAIEIFQNLKDKYLASQRVSSGEVDKYLGALGAAR